MSVRQYITDKLAGLVDFFDVLSTKQGDSDSVLAEVQGGSYEDASETYPDSEVWGQAGVLSRPQASSEGAQAVGLRVGDEVVTISTRDTRYQVSVEEGEAVLHSLGDDGVTQAVVRVQKDGTVKVEGVAVLIGGDAATESQTLGDTLHSFLGSLRAWLVLHTHGGVTTGGGTSGIPSTSVPSLPETRSANHKVEP